MAAAKKPQRHQAQQPVKSPQQPLAEPVPGQQRIIAQHATFEGPLPPPDLLAKYDAITPGFAERIVLMAETEQKHRHAIEDTVVSRSFDEAQRGQNFGLIIGAVAILAGAATAVLGAPVSGSIIGGGGVIGLVSVFVLGRFFPTSKTE